MQLWRLILFNEQCYQKYGQQNAKYNVYGMQM